MTGRARITAALLVVSILPAFLAFGQSAPVSADQVGAPQPGMALIYLMRTNKMVNKAVLDEVTLDGVPWGTLPAGSYLIAQVKAGPHELAIGGPRHRKKYVEARQFSIGAGQVQYLVRSHSMSKGSTMFVDAKWAQEFLATHAPSPGNLLAAGLPRAGATAQTAASSAAGSGGGSRAAWASAGRWAEVGVLISAEKTQEAIALASRMLLETPDDAQGYFLRGLAYSMQGDTEFAEASYDRAIELQPEYGEALAFRGFAREKLGQHEAAEADLSAALALGVETIAVYMDQLQGRWTTGVHRRRAAVRMALGRPEDALADLERAMALEPDNPYLYLDRGRALLLAGQVEAASNDAMTLVGLLPELPWAYVLLGQVKLWQGEYDDAARMLQRGLAQTSGDDDHADAGRGAILAHLAMAERLDGSSAEAMGYVQEAVTLQQEQPQAATYVLLGTLLHEAGRTAEAGGAFRRAAELDPEMLDHMAAASHRAGASPQTRAFLDHRIAVATSYLGGSTAPTSPEVIIHAVKIEPSPVPAGEAFDFVIDSTVSDPAMPAGPVPAQLVVEIVKDGAVVFTVPEREMSVDNGSRSSWIEHMNPTDAVGDYIVRVRLAGRGAEAVTETDFRIE
jgi:tetratricopeptide (TPR) repeat protein